VEKFDTLMVHAGYEIDPVTKSVTPPIYQTNAYVFDSTEHAKNLFELKEAGNIYTRIMNPTVDILEKRIAALEGGVGALAVSSGHAAIAMTVLNLAVNGDEIISSGYIYGGAINLLGVSFANLGIKVRFVDINNLKEVEDNINDKTKFIFAETIGNPNADIADIEALAEIAHRHGLPLIIDSTFTSPYLIRPFEYGADIVTHSATKCLDGHSNAMGGIVVDSGKFKWKEGNFYSGQTLFVGSRGF
jgi:O-acetylhomoserine (thiol)-lyase